MASDQHIHSSQDPIVDTVDDEVIISSVEVTIECTASPVKRPKLTVSDTVHHLSSDEDTDDDDSTSCESVITSDSECDVKATGEHITGDHVIYSPNPTPPDESGAGDLGVDHRVAPIAEPTDNVLRCADCHQSVVNFASEKWIKCSSHCHQYYHISCVGLNRRAYDLIRKTTAIKWICLKCLDKESKDRPLFKFV